MFLYIWPYVNVKIPCIFHVFLEHENPFIEIFSVFVVIMQAVVKQVFLRKTVIQAINNDLRQIVSEHKLIKWWRNTFLYHFPKHKKLQKMEHNWFQVTIRWKTFINDTKMKTRTNDINTQWENKLLWQCKTRW